MRSAAVLTLLAGVTASSVGEAWIDTITNNLPSHPIKARHAVLDNVKKLAENYVKEAPGGKAPEDYPYFAFFPQFIAGVKAGDAPVTWTGRCGYTNSAVSVAQANGSVKLSITSSGLAQADCAENLDLLTVTGAKRIALDELGTFEIEWELPADVRDAELWDLQNKGVRFFQYHYDEKTTVASVLETVKLFIPEETQVVDPISARTNVDFMAKYPQFKMEQRDPLTNRPPLEHQVHSGDFFGIIRLDGLDPTLAWGMGSTTGHVTTALWMDGELFITESTVTDSYWPTNGIQKTPYKQWLKQAEQASYNVVWAPLDKKHRAMFNETAAVEFFMANEGLDYGYRNMLWGWVDTVKSNYPCVPGDYSTICTSWEYFESMFGILDRKVQPLVDLFVNQAFNFRIGTTGLRLPEILQAGAAKGYSGAEIPAIPEQDSWLYQTTKGIDEVPTVGRSMVCCVYVCSSWKAAGLFGDKEVNCGEFTNADDYSLAFFEDEYKQIMGRWTLSLNKFNIKKPYDHMAEKCASLPPLYEQQVDC